MEPDDLRRLVAYLQDLVQMPEPGVIRFDLPDQERLLADGLHPEAVGQLFAAPWLDDMIADVRETPEFCDPGDPPAQTLGFARDVVEEYLRKRFQL